MQNTSLTTWLTQSEAARRLGVSREAIRQAITSRRIEWNGRRGRECRVRGGLQSTGTLPPLMAAVRRPPAATPPRPSRTSPPSDTPAVSRPASRKDSNNRTPSDLILDARLRKLESDIELQSMRLSSQRQEIRDQALEEFENAYRSAFSPLKKLLLSLDLSADILQQIADVADRCEEDFSEKIKKNCCKT
jgi:hypothetical protein